jgi:hypothetical protein
MKKIFPFAIIALAAVVFLLPVQAAANRIGIGFDLIRLVDENQDDGMLNIHGQVKVADDIALCAGYAKGDEVALSDVGVKYYLGRHMDSLFLQAGICFFRHDAGNDNGFVGAFGLDYKLMRHLAFSSAFRIITGVDHDYWGYPESPLFQAAFSLMLAF